MHSLRVQSRGETGKKPKLRRLRNFGSSMRGQCWESWRAARTRLCYCVRRLGWASRNTRSTASPQTVWYEKRPFDVWNSSTLWKPWSGNHTRYIRYPDHVARSRETRWMETWRQPLRDRSADTPFSPFLLDGPEICVRAKYQLRRDPTKEGTSETPMGEKCDGYLNHSYLEAKWETATKLKLNLILKKKMIMLAEEITSLSLEVNTNKSTCIPIPQSWITDHKIIDKKSNITDHIP